MTNENITNDFSKQPAEAHKPAAVIVLDQDGNPVEVEVLGPTEVQDIEYTDDKNGN
jgi:hypothetical protein